jgi:hypothetical protein
MPWRSPPFALRWHAISRPGTERGWAEVRRIGAEWPADAIRLDAYDAEAGAAEFFRKCGFREVSRAAYRKVPLVYLELLW